MSFGSYVRARFMRNTGLVLIFLGILGLLSVVFSWIGWLVVVATMPLGSYMFTKGSWMQKKVEPRGDYGVRPVDGTRRCPRCGSREAGRICGACGADI